MKKIKPPASADDLKPAPYNPREINAQALAGLSKSVEKFGDISGIVWNSKTGLLVAGHQRVETLKAQGAKFRPDPPRFELNGASFPIRVVNWNKTFEQAANISANNPHIAGEFTDDLQGILDAVKDKMPEFEELNLAELIETKPVLEDAEVQAPPEKPVSQLGDLWLLGEHRVLCGDSTAESDVARLFDDVRFDLCVTSPPYAAQRTYHIGDFDWLALMTGVWDRAVAHAGERANLLVNLGLVHQDHAVFRYWDPWLAHAEAGGWPLFGWYVWDKGFGLCGDSHGRLTLAHEFFFHFTRGGGRTRKWVKTQGKSRAFNMFRQRDGSMKPLSSPATCNQPFKVPDSVIRTSPAMGNPTGHPAVYPIELPGFCMRSWTDEGAAVYDPFLGSGTTVIAAEQLERKCYGMEISPAYVDVIVQRWQAFTEKDVTLEGTSKTFAEIETKRKGATA